MVSVGSSDSGEVDAEVCLLRAVVECCKQLFYCLFTGVFGLRHSGLYTVLQAADGSYPVTFIKQLLKRLVYGNQRVCVCPLSPHMEICLNVCYSVLQMLIVDLTEGAENTFITCVSIACAVFPPRVQKQTYRNNHNTIILVN